METTVILKEDLLKEVSSVTYICYRNPGLVKHLKFSQYKQALLIKLGIQGEFFSQTKQKEVCQWETKVCSEILGYIFSSIENTVLQKEGNISSHFPPQENIFSVILINFINFQKIDILQNSLYQYDILRKWEHMPKLPLKTHK